MNNRSISTSTVKSTLVKTVGKSSSIQRWLFAVLVAGFLWVLISRFTEIRQLLGTLVQGQLSWIALAAGLQIGYYVVFATLFWAAFRLVDVPTRVRDLLPITFASLFVNATMPSAGTAGIALFVDDARRRGHSPAAATAGTLLVQVSNNGVFVVILSLGLVLLFRHHNLTVLEIISALIMFLLVGSMIFVLALGIFRPNWLFTLFTAVFRIVNGLGRLVKRPSLLPEAWPQKNAQEFIGAATAISTHPGRLGLTLVIALVMHLISMVSLVCLFLAFHQPLSAITLIAGYTMSFLFMMVSPTPSGIGVVEVIVPIIYTSMGIPVEVGTAITLSFRGLSFWIPMLVGFFLLRQLSMFSSSERALAESGQVRLVAILTALMGVLNVLSVIQPELVNKFSALTQYSPVAVRQNGAITAVLAGFALLTLAYGLWRHKRMAWFLTLLMLALSVVGHLLKQNYAEATLAGLLAIYVFAQRSHFHALSDEPSVWQGVQMLAAAFAFTLAYGIIGFYVLDRVYGLPFSLAEAWQQTFLFFTISSEPGLFQLETPFDYLAASIYIVGAATLVYALLMLLRPVLVRAPAGEAERRKAQRIVNRYGRSSLAHLVPLGGKSYYFTRGGSVVAFSLLRRTAIALGDPIGPPEDAPATIQQFREYCQRRDWRTVFYRAMPDHLAAYHDAGLQTISIGQEIAVNLADWTPPEQQETAGWRTAVYHPPFSPDLVERLRLVSDEWLSHLGREENRFAHGWFSRSYINQGVLATLSTQGKDMLAFIHAVPTPTSHQLAVTLFRCRQGFTAVARHQLLLALTQWAKKQGYVSLNLGLHALPPHITGDNQARDRVAQVIYKAVEPPLLEADWPELEKWFAVDAAPRYLVYPGSASLPVVWSALARAGGSSVWSQWPQIFSP